MEELEIEISELEAEIQHQQNAIKSLLNYGNVPEENWRRVYDKMHLMFSNKSALGALRSLKKTIDSNLQTH